MIYVLYGQPGSGKTTISKLLADHLDTPHLIDGDKFRTMFHNRGSRLYKDKAAGYSEEGRILNITRANAVATYLHKTGERDVILAFVNPYVDIRCNLIAHNPGQVRLIYLSTERDVRKSFHVDVFEIGEPDLHLDTDKYWRFNWNKLKALADKVKASK